MPESLWRFCGRAGRAKGLSGASSYLTALAAIAHDVEADHIKEVLAGLELKNPLSWPEVQGT